MCVCVGVGVDVDVSRGTDRQHRQAGRAGREKTREEWKQGLSVLSSLIWPASGTQAELGIQRRP